MGRWRKSRTQKSAQSPWNPFNIGSAVIRPERNGSATAALCSVASPKKAKQINGKSLQAEKEQRISIDRRITRLKVWHLSFCSPEQLSAFGPSRAMATVVSSFGQKLNFLWNFVLLNWNKWISGWREDVGPQQKFVLGLHQVAARRGPFHARPTVGGRAVVQSLRGHRSRQWWSHLSRFCLLIWSLD